MGDGGKDLTLLSDKSRFFVKLEEDRIGILRGMRKQKQLEVCDMGTMVDFEKARVMSETHGGMNESGRSEPQKHASGYRKKISPQV